MSSYTSDELKHMNESQINVVQNPYDHKNPHDLNGKKYLLEAPSAAQFMTVIEEAVNQVKECGTPIEISVRITDGTVIDKPDKLGKTVDKSLIGTYWRHYKNNNVYAIVGFSWDGTTDEWQVLFNRDGEPAFFNRSLADFSAWVTSPEERND